MKNMNRFTTIDTNADLDRGIAALGDVEPVFADVFAQTGRPPLRRRQGGFEGLLSIVVAQQVSRASADAIWSRVVENLAPITAERFADLGEDDLRGVGLSGPKIRTTFSVTDAVMRGALDFASLGGLEDEDVMARLTAIKGIGPWTAEIYLLACLGRADSWPAGDLAIQVAVGEAFGLDGRPDAKSLRRFSEPWAPWRGVAARLLWAYYALKRSRDVAP